MSDNFDHSHVGYDHGLHAGDTLGHPDPHHQPGSGLLHLFGSPLAAPAAVHGNPAEAVNDWYYQGHNGACLPASVTQVVGELTGHEPALQDAIAKMHELNLAFDLQTGTPNFQEAQTLLEQGYHIPCDIENSSVPQLEHYLDEGRSVILAVNGHDIWHDVSDPGTGPDHAVVITSIDENAVAPDGSRGMVTLSDTGVNYGQGHGPLHSGNEEKVSLQDFKTAWATSHNELLVTKMAAHPDGTPLDHPGPVLLPPMPIHPHPFTPPVTPAAANYTVQPGDTLWNIAEHEYGDGSQFHRIADANGITNPALIHPGQALIIPR